MKVVQILESCNLKGGSFQNEIDLKKNQFYIFSDDFHKRLKIIIEKIIGIEIPFKDVINRYEGQDLSGRKLLALRHGGGGDILFMTTALTELKRKFPSSKLSVAINPTYFDLVRENPNIHEIISLPISLDEWNQFHYHATFENLIENNKFAERENAYDLFLRQLAQNPKDVLPENKIPEIFVTEEEERSLRMNFPPLQSPSLKVGIQVETSTPLRNYPVHNFTSVIEALLKKEYDVYLFGTHANENSINYLIKQASKPEKVFKILGSLREAVLFAKQMNFIIAPDSMFIHIGGAFRIPVIGLYGPFLSRLRMLYFKDSAGIDSYTACSPCFQHGHHPCLKGEPSPCLANISPETIIEVFEELERTI